MSGLDVLIGLVVSKAEEVHDYLQIVFSDDTRLSIFNNHLFDRGSLLNMQNKKVESVKESEDRILLIFDDCSFISIGLKDEDYNGPEAMVLKREGKALIVWN